jgi:hypothetical protein
MEAFDLFGSISDFDHLKLRPYSPMHSPAWRWLRARLLADSGARATPRLDDDEVRRARDFLVKGAGSAIRPHGKPSRFESAVELARDADALRRGELDAYLLTERPFDDIAARLRIAPEVVETYHSLFFAVRDHPKATDWLMSHAVGCGPANDFAGPHPVGIWKYGAFSGGAPLLDIILAITLDRPFPAWILKSCGNQAGEVERRLRLLAKATIGVMISGCHTTIRHLVSIRAEIDRLESMKSARVSNQETSTLDLMGRFLTITEKRGHSRKLFNELLGDDRKARRPTTTNDHERTSTARAKQESTATGGNHGPR